MSNRLGFTVLWNIVSAMAAGCNLPNGIKATQRSMQFGFLTPIAMSVDGFGPLKSAFGNANPAATLSALSCCEQKKLVPESMLLFRCHAQ